MPNPTYSELRELQKQYKEEKKCIAAEEYPKMKTLLAAYLTRTVPSIRARCPYCTNNTFTVNHKTQWGCYSCGAGGRGLAELQEFLDTPSPYGTWEDLKQFLTERVVYEGDHHIQARCPECEAKVFYARSSLYWNCTKCGIEGAGLPALRERLRTPKWKRNLEKPAK